MCLEYKYNQGDVLGNIKYVIQLKGALHDNEIRAKNIRTGPLFEKIGAVCLSAIVKWI